MSLEAELVKRCTELATELANTTIELSAQFEVLESVRNENNRLKTEIATREGEWTGLRDKYQELLTNLSTAGMKQVSDLNEKIQIQRCALEKIIEIDSDASDTTSSLYRCGIIAKEALTQNKIKMETKEGNDTAIIIITYNNSNLIKRQVELIRRFHKEPVDIIVVDNSTDSEVVEQIKYYIKDLGCLYLKTDATSKNGSESHCFSANLSYLTFKNSYKFMMYLDFDCFPLKPFSIKEMLTRKIITGMGQNKDGIEYFWAGCVLWNNEEIDQSMIDFSVSHELKLDSGGMMFKIINRYGKDLCPFLNEIHVQNPDFNKSFYNFYSVIGDGLFMHFINSSHWRKLDDDFHAERINSLLNILEEKTK